VPLGEEIPLERHQIVVPPKKSLFSPLLARLAWERLQIGYLQLNITSTANDLSGGTNIDHLEQP